MYTIPTPKRPDSLQISTKPRSLEFILEFFCSVDIWQAFKMTIDDR